MKKVRIGRLVLRERDQFFSCEVRLSRFDKLLKKGSKAFIESEAMYEDEDDLSCPPELHPQVKKGIAWLLANEAACAKAAVAAIRKAHPDANLRKDVRLLSVQFHEIDSRRPYIGFIFRCSWEEEHGLGVMMCGTRPVKVGGADTALLEWIARGDARKRRKKKR